MQSSYESVYGFVPFPDRPQRDWDDTGLWMAAINQVVWGEFGSTCLNHASTEFRQLRGHRQEQPLRSLGTMGLVSCTGVLLDFTSKLGRHVGAVAHYKSGDLLGDVLEEILDAYDMNDTHGKLLANVDLAVNNCDTLVLVQNELRRKGFRIGAIYGQSQGVIRDVRGTTFDHLAAMRMLDGFV